MSKLLIDAPFMLGFGSISKALEQISKCENYPPYNIVEYNEESMFICIAVAGFDEQDLFITQENNHLIIIGEKQEKEIDVVYLHRGLSFRKFRKVFILAEDIEPVRSCLDKGILTIELKKQPVKKDIKIIPINKQLPTK